MAQTTDSQPNHPTIVFQVNLETVNRTGHLVPNRTEAATGETVAEADNMKNTRTLWLPGINAASNIGGRSGPGAGNGSNFKHGDQFTVKGMKAVYLKNLYVTGSVDDVLQIVSES